MTNEEIQQRYDALWPSLPTGQTMGLEDHGELERLVIEFARSLVLQAYEEAAQKLEALACLDGESTSAGWARLDSAKFVRALKDSLVQGTVST